MLEVSSAGSWKGKATAALLAPRDIMSPRCWYLQAAHRNKTQNYITVCVFAVCISKGKGLRGGGVARQKRKCARVETCELCTRFEHTNKC